MENLRGILLMIFAMAAFALEDTFIKSAATVLPAGQIIMVIGLMGTLAFAVIAHRRGQNLLDPQLRHPAVLLRNVCEVIGTLCMVTAITLLPLSTVSAIQQALPLVMTLLAAVFLRESVGWRRWSAIAVGFAGVLLIIRPGGESFDPRVGWALGTVLAMSIRDLAVRRVPPGLPNMVIGCYGFGAMATSGVILLAFSGGAAWPSTTNWLQLIAGAVAGVAAYSALITATRIGDVAVITPFRYSRMIFAMILGMLFFAERPDLATYAGATLIIASGLYTFVRERRLARQYVVVPPVV